MKSVYQPTSPARLVLRFIVSFGAVLLTASYSARAQPCAATIVQDTIAAATSGEPVAVCADFDFRTALRSDLFLDGRRINGQPGGCDFDTLVYYPYFTFPDRGQAGPYDLVSWTVDGRAFNGTFVDIDELVDQLNVFDPSGNWFDDPITQNIVGGGDGTRYGQMVVRQASGGTQRAVTPNFQAIANGTLVMVDGPGFHTYDIFDPQSGCRDTLIVFLKPILDDDIDTVSTSREVTTRVFCVDNGGLIGAPQLATRCSTPQNGTLNETSPYCFTYTPNTGFSGSETVCIEVCDDTRQLGGPVCQRSLITVTVNDVIVPRRDTVRITMTASDTTACLDAVLQVSRPITSVALCSAASADVELTPNTNGCVLISPRPDFAGAFEGCVVHCAQGVCDTTVLRIDVLADCDIGLLTVRLDSVSEQGNPTPYCLPIREEVMAGLTFTIDGQPYAGRREGCDVQTVFFYNYGPLYERGTDGPYRLFQWSANGRDYNDRFQDIDELIDLMRAADPAGDWRADKPDFQLVGGDPAGTYGIMTIIHDATGIRSDLRPNPVSLPRATSIDLPGAGSYDLRLRDPATGCTDDLTVVVGTRELVGTSDTIRVTVDYQVQSVPVCFFTPDSEAVSVCAAASNGSVSLNDTGCAVYSPANGFTGLDTFCAYVCPLPDMVPCDTTVIIYTVVRQPLPVDTVHVESFGDSPFQACAELNPAAGYLPARICGTDGPFVAEASAGTCVTIDPVDGAAANGVICAEFCRSDEPDFCKRVIFIVTQTAACSADVFGSDTLRLAASAGGTSVCLGGGIDLSGFTVTVDGRAATLSQEAGCGRANGTGGTADVYAYPFQFGLPSDTYRIEGWQANSDFVANVVAVGAVALADSMSSYDVNATWTYVAADERLEADLGTGNYSPLVITNVTASESRQIPVQTITGSGGGQFVPGSVLTLPNPGRYDVVATRNDGTCADRQLIYVQPAVNPTRDTINQRVTADTISGLLCLDVTQLGNTPTSIGLCGGATNGEILLVNLECYTYEPTPGYVGADTACVIVCTDGGMTCDTTVIAFDVVASTRVTPTRDTIAQRIVGDRRNGPFCIATSQLPGAPTSISSCGDPSNGTIGFTNQNCYVYTPNAGYRGSDQACVIICSGTVCDTTVIDFDVVAPPSSGPRRDTIEQLITADVLNGPFCLDISQLPGAPTSTTSCGDPANGALALTDDNCYTYLPNTGYLGRDAACLVICSGAICDTTVINFTVVVQGSNPPTRDTITQRVQPDILNGPYCLDISQLPGAPTSTTSCGDPINGALALTDDNCYTYRPNDGYLGTDTACLVICSGAVCDTTVISFQVGDPPVVLPTRDTVTQRVLPNILNGPYCIDVAQLPGAITSTTSCGDPTNGTLALTDDNCYTYRPNDDYSGPDAACLVICSGAVCDTTVIRFIVGDIIIRTPTRDTLSRTVVPDTTNGPYCLDISELPGPPTSATSCGEPRNGTLAFTNDNCFTYRPDDGFLGQDTTCLILCSGAVCDTTVVVFTVREQTPCLDFTVLTPLSFELPNCSATARFEFSVGNADIDAVRLELDGTPIVGSRSGDIISVVLPVGGYQLLASDAVTACESVFDIVVTCNPGCELPFLATSFSQFVDCEQETVAFCLPVSAESLAGFTVSVDSVIYTGPYRECGSVERFVFDVGTLGAGPFAVDSFLINGVLRSATVGTLGALRDSLAVWDSGAAWVYNPATATISGGSATGQYGVLPVTDLSTQRATSLTPALESMSSGVSIVLPQGASFRNLRVAKDDSTCLQDVSLQLTCVTNDAESLDIPEGSDQLYCVPTNELNGPIVSLRDVCATDETIVAIDFDAPEGCVILRGLELGERRICLVACDALGVCDTTFVSASVGAPRAADDLRAVDDEFGLRQNTALTRNLITNDTFVGVLDAIRITSPPREGVAEVDEFGSLAYTPTADRCGFTDTLSYEICQNGVCDEAVVSLRVRCGLVEVFDGISPNGDGINDFLRIDGLEDFPEHTLTIYNRWGNEVFEVRTYRNNWGGTWENATLTNGTYFYILEIDGEEPITGWVQLER